MSYFRPEFFLQAMQQYDPQRTPSENLDRITDAISPFTGPLNGEQQQHLQFEIDDELRRRRGMNFFDSES